MRVKVIGTNQPPQWALNLIRQVGRSKKMPDFLRLNWRVSAKHRYSSGQTWNTTYNIGDKTYHPSSKVTVTAGFDEQDTKLILLHELAHVMTPGNHHNKKFWDTAFRLYAKYGVDLEYAKKCEGDYKKGAIRAADRVIASVAARERMLANP